MHLPGQNFQASLAVHGSDDIAIGNFWSQVNSMIKCSPQVVTFCQIRLECRTLFYLLWQCSQIGYSELISCESVPPWSAKWRQMKLTLDLESSRRSHKDADHWPLLLLTQTFFLYFWLQNRFIFAFQNPEIDCFVRFEGFRGSQMKE